MSEGASKQNGDIKNEKAKLEPKRGRWADASEDLDSPCFRPMEYEDGVTMSKVSLGPPAHSAVDSSRSRGYSHAPYPYGSQSGKHGSRGGRMVNSSDIAAVLVSNLDSHVDEEMVKGMFVKFRPHNVHLIPTGARVTFGSYNDASSALSLNGKVPNGFRFQRQPLQVSLASLQQTVSSPLMSTPNAHGGASHEQGIIRGTTGILHDPTMKGVSHMGGRRQGGEGFMHRGHPSGKHGAWTTAGDSQQWRNSPDFSSLRREPAIDKDTVLSPQPTLKSFISAPAQGMLPGGSPLPAPVVQRKPLGLRPRTLPEGANRMPEPGKSAIFGEATPIFDPVSGGVPPKALSSAASPRVTVSSQGADTIQMDSAERLVEGRGHWASAKRDVGERQDAASGFKRSSESIPQKALASSVPVRAKQASTIFGEAKPVDTREVDWRMDGKAREVYASEASLAVSKRRMNTREGRGFTKPYSPATSPLDEALKSRSSREAKVEDTAVVESAPLVQPLAASTPPKAALSSSPFRQQEARLGSGFYRQSESSRLDTFFKEPCHTSLSGDAMDSSSAVAPPTPLKPRTLTVKGVEAVSKDGMPILPAEEATTVSARPVGTKAVEGGLDTSHTAEALGPMSANPGSTSRVDKLGSFLEHFLAPSPVDVKEEERTGSVAAAQDSIPAILRKPELKEGENVWQRREKEQANRVAQLSQPALKDEGGAELSKEAEALCEHVEGLTLSDKAVEGEPSVEKGEAEEGVGASPSTLPRTIQSSKESSNFVRRKRETKGHQKDSRERRLHHKEGNEGRLRLVDMRGEQRGGSEQRGKNTLMTPPRQNRESAGEKHVAPASPDTVHYAGDERSNQVYGMSSHTRGQEVHRTDATMAEREGMNAVEPASDGTKYSNRTGATRTTPGVEEGFVHDGPNPYRSGKFHKGGMGMRSRDSRGHTDTRNKGTSNTYQQEPLEGEASQYKSGSMAGSRRGGAVRPIEKQYSQIRNRNPAATFGANGSHISGARKKTSMHVMNNESPPVKTQNRFDNLEREENGD